MTKKNSMQKIIIFISLGLAVLNIQFVSLVPGALAAGVDSNWGSYSQKEQNPDWSSAKNSIAAKDYAKAIQHLQKYIAKNPKNANAHNYLGYAFRGLGKLKESGVAYEKALTINPRHLGALEYQGQLYLKLGQVEKAKANLSKLDNLCLFGCDEYTTLKNSIAQYNSK
jgi:tetratricopeptide (TPR) repeat protein